MKHREGYKGFVIEVRIDKLADGEFSAEFTLEEHDGSGVTETLFFVPGRFPSEQSALTATIHAGRTKINAGFGPSPSNML